MKQFKMLLLSSMVLFFTACGGGSSSSDSIIETDTPQSIAIDKIMLYADDNTQPVPTIQDYEDAGVIGVTSENIDDVNEIVASLTAGDVSSTEKIQKIVNDLGLTTVIPGGILDNNTTLTIEDSPYILNETLQIDRNVTLTVDPGVEIKGMGRFEVFGTIKINGTAEDRVVLNDIYIMHGNNNYGEIARIEIIYADIEGGGIYPSGFGAGRYGMLILRNSIVTNLASTYMYILDPTADCYIENNIFENIEGGILVGNDDGIKIYIRNNVFVKNARITSSGNDYDIDDMVVQYNSFLATDQIAVSLSLPEAQMNARYNFWNTTDVDTINSMIHDHNDDLTLDGSIEYTPFLSEPDSNTPAYP